MTIFYVKPSNSAFVRFDQEILEKKFRVISYTLDMTSKVKFLLSLIILTFKLIIHIFHCQVLYTRFADYYAALLAVFAKLFGKKLVIVIGGYDVCHIPEVKFGIYVKKFRGWCATFAMNNADLLLPNSEAMIYRVNRFAIDRPTISGIKHFVPATKAKIQLLYNGFKVEQNFNIPENKKENLVLTVAVICDYLTFKMKGIDYFVEAARQLPEYNFVLIGVHNEIKELYLKDTSPNLTIYEPIPYKDVFRWYQKAKVFSLLSLSEGMPNVLCESMLCECVPVGFDFSPITEIIGNSGFLIKNKNMEDIIIAIKKAIESADINGSIARQRIIENFSFEKREKELVECINSV